MEWISVKKKNFPKGKFLAMNKDLDQAVVWNHDGGFVKGSWYGSCEYGCGGNDYFEEITHWMPLPELPK